jgi:hypothetical protein
VSPLSWIKRTLRARRMRSAAEPPRLGDGPYSCDIKHVSRNAEYCSIGHADGGVCRVASTRAFEASGFEQMWASNADLAAFTSESRLAPFGWPNADARGPNRSPICPANRLAIASAQRSPTRFAIAMIGTDQESSPSGGQNELDSESRSSGRDTWAGREDIRRGGGAELRDIPSGEFRIQDRLGTRNVHDRRMRDRTELARGEAWSAVVGTSFQPGLFRLLYI